MSGLGNKLARLRGMDRDELLYRLREHFNRRADVARMLYHRRRRRRPGWRFVKGLLGGRSEGEPVLCYLREQAAPRFYLPASGSQRRELFETVRARFSHGVEQAIKEAEGLCGNRVSLLGLGELELGDIDWQRDPLTGARWPRRAGMSYDLVAEDNVGDPKIVHELNRHQHLARLGKAYALTGDERFARHALAQLESWIEQNPENSGINWSSSLEIAIRVLSWMWTIFFILPSDAFDERRARAVLGSLFAQMNHVHRYLSVYSTPNTHLIGEAVALFIVGQVFRGLPHADAWFDRGLQLMLEEIERQDVGGVHAELSSYYHCYTVDFFLQGLILAQHNGTSIPRRALRRLEDEIEFLVHLTRPDGTIPLLGDDDGGRALALSTTDYRSFADALATGAVLFDRPEWKWAGNGLREETLWLLGADAKERYWALDAASPLRLYDDRSAAGYHVQRTGWGPGDAHFTFDCGGLGFLGGGHGHADALSITAYGPEGEILVDPGTYVYNLQPRWRDHFRATQTHNTVVIDGQSQSVPADTFRWSTAGKARLTGRHSVPWLQFVEGRYQREAVLGRHDTAVWHRRRVLHVVGEYWLIFDDVGPDDGVDHDIELFYHFAPESHPLEIERPDCRNVVHVGSNSTGSVFGLGVCGSVPFTAEVIRGRDEPPQGWVSRRYGERVAAPVLRLACRAALPASFVTLLAPFGSRLDAEGAGPSAAGGGVPAIKLRYAEPGSAVAVTIETPGRTDWVVSSPRGNAMRLPDIDTVGELFWMRCSGARLERFFARGALQLRDRGRVVLEHVSPVPYAAQIVEPHSNRSSDPTWLVS